MSGHPEIHIVKAPANPKHQLLADEYLISGNQSDAARKAGYSERTAGVQAAQILKKPDVAEYLAARRAQLTQQATFSAERVEKELTSLAFSNVADYTRLNDDGDLEVDFSGSTRDQLSAVAGVKVKKRKIYDREGNLVGEEHNSEFKLWDKLRATELLGKQHGMFKEAEQRVVVDVADRLLAARTRVRAGVSGMLPAPLSDEDDSAG